MHNKLRLCAAAALLCAASFAGAQTPAPMPPLTPEQRRFHDIYKELVEINTTHLSGNNTEAAQAMRKHLLDAGFKADEIQLFEVKFTLEKGKAPPRPVRGPKIIKF